MTIGGTDTTYMPERDGQGFAIDIPVDNSSGAVTAAVQVDALRHDGTLDLDLHRRLSGDYTVPAATPQVPTYDADGNMLSYDGWTYTWNAQDRLDSASKGNIRLEFAYDYMGRRFEKKVYENNVLTKHSLFVYDGFKQIAEYDALASNALTNTYIWQPVGLDVPLLRNGSELLVSDANKNIVALIDTTGQVTDSYIYDPFGSCIHTGLSDNPFRFSSEYFDKETGLVYYNYRYYSSILGRWLSRDLLDDNSKALLYVSCHNNPIFFYDRLGMFFSCARIKKEPERKPYQSVEIKVEKCTILVIYGHNFQNPSYERHVYGVETIQNISAASGADGCAYAAVLACFASLVPNSIPLPGYSPVGDKTWVIKRRGIGTIVHPRANDVAIDEDEKDPVADDKEEAEKILQAAKQKASELKKGACCCKEVQLQLQTYDITDAPTYITNRKL